MRVDGTCKSKHACMCWWDCSLMQNHSREVTIFSLLVEHSDNLWFVYMWMQCLELWLQWPTTLSLDCPIKITITITLKCNQLVIDYIYITASLLCSLLHGGSIKRGFTVVNVSTPSQPFHQHHPTPSNIHQGGMEPVEELDGCGGPCDWPLREGTWSFNTSSTSCCLLR